MILQSLIITSVLTLALVPNPSGDKTQKRDDPHGDFTAFLENQLNPRSNDYGRELQAIAEVAFQQTLANAYFWLTAVSLGGGGLLSLHIAYLLQQRKRRELISAKILAWYHNELVTARESLKNVASTPTAPETVGGTSEQTADNSAESFGELNRLRQQVMSQAANEKVLKGQINMLSKKLNDEKQKNKSLKIE